MVQIVDSAWFGARAQSAVRDFFELCENNLAALEASARTL